ncbi:MULTISPECIES: GumC family protein [unclassified Meridianimarinicoccus]|uniref:GumC family protein n=1 Tax=unclassified Meridianimarinicoccus TaxID=2923344 RepID=UPI001866A98B|nr:Wzz/FepE/Etk N-terminal domain-containing protein [Fluviibacterium sp. MJW13]
MKLDLKYYLRVFMRRSPYFILITALFSSIGFSIAMLLPAEYEARATLLVEAEQIPAALAASTVQVQAAEQLQIIEQRLLTRANLLDMANRLGLYADSDQGSAPTATAIVTDMRNRTTFRATNTVKPSSRRNAPATTLLTITYRGDSPAKVAEVTNEFVTLVLQENVEIRTEQAGDTLEFFEQEVDRLGTELDTQSARLLEYEAQAGLALPQHLEYLRNRLASLNTGIDTRARQIVVLEDQKKRLEDLFRLTGGVAGAGAGGQMTPRQQQLEAARQALSDAELIYSKTNPKLTMLAAKVKQIEDQVAAEAVTASGLADEVEDQKMSQQEAQFRAQLSDLDSQVELLRSEIEELNAEIAGIEALILEAPANGVGLSKLQRDFNNTQGQYNTAVARLSKAATGERIELLAKGQRISVIEQAIRPDRPSSPNRPLIMAGGVGAGMATGLGIILLMELLNKSIRRPVELTNKLGITPIAVLPYIRTDREIFVKRMMVFGAIAFFIIFIPLGMYAIHTLVVPLETILEPFLNRVGYSMI